ncbi:anaerobic ribonucleoside-triphosphate reductase activating protein [Prevotella sp. P3-120]|uniref:anaerobic ribonucleoside-triphosphate reductase activating protein n=1 Tax=unclassified Prevotella TaxID=2638335 RepID=UPI000B972327|nr:MULTISPECIES: anaerobic ribonucleoside-triphosphate reductase activating protein [unclassified Prevotella]OYP50689.1 anaerobic ribonucleoside-triphosphate reductase activating protein [Prevotella sp. P3-92]OYP52412.1 anaerobic ribonucleoside-triphosphate reductase activating protein [Prevotella sp. P3-120]
MIQVLDIIEDTMVDGPGFRTSIYCAGCHHECPGCHNPQSWNPGGGHPMTTDEVMKIIVADPYANVTFSGGDPMYQAEGFTELARAIRSQTQKTIWCYTGFTFEAIVKIPRYRQLLDEIDVLVDGPFVKSLRDEDLLFRGSSNQRLVDVPASLAKGEVVEFHPDVEV